MGVAQDRIQREDLSATWKIRTSLPPVTEAATEDQRRDCGACPVTSIGEIFLLKVAGGGGRDSWMVAFSSASPHVL